MVTLVRMQPRSARANPTVEVALAVMAEAERTMSHRRHDPPPVVDEQGSAPGVLALAH
ncbi:hypothetical protein ACFYM0_24445 [Streptomyces sp. NPDC006487]|uniref:hypothetical protein n=1 Tax=Streptomyces sp. NPDC006487 TaxID=3364748 RepID=UPI003692F901